MAPPRSSPPQIKHIIGSEACERFSFYGMASILVLYMNEHLLYPERDAKAYYHAFIMAAYLAPLLGSWIAARFLDRYRTIVALSFAYVLGYGVLAAWETRAGLFIGLALLAAASGSIKPCLSELVGEQLSGEDAALRQRVYGWLYWLVNVGSATSNLLVPALLVAFGPRVAFAVPGMLMAASLLVFRSRRDRYVTAAAPAGPNPHGFVRVVARAIARLGTGQPGQHWLDLARDTHPEEAVDGAKAVFRIMAVFAGVTLFWALFDQRGSSWVFQARQMELTFAGTQLSPAQMQALSPLLVLLMLPLANRVVFPALERRGIALPPLRKMAAGMFVTVLAFAVGGVVQMLIDAGHAPHALWQLPQYVLLTAGEVLVSVTGLEFSYTQAPRAMRSTIMSIWFLTVSVGNLLTAAVTELVPLGRAGSFWFFAALMLAAAFAFRAIARAWGPRAESPRPDVTLAQ